MKYIVTMKFAGNGGSEVVSADTIELLQSKLIEFDVGDEYEVSEDELQIINDTWDCDICNYTFLKILQSGEIKVLKAYQYDSGGYLHE